ncbi:LysR substrate-binding domain-containing protein [Cupriavidus agavae]|uniref:DNA-binding transcriptional LysR family regulator n=1 Tax=Cupriavidus agavae TaxID=1001822 RepID=A0A4Q7RTC3_9BURK|nr:LysR substrate-binding domain-containing protein [Cupriavidus agavae]RZT36377.1 DNA-binding transcriptional LysR family regulator [Cupriavidus agavae]
MQALALPDAFRSRIRLRHLHCFVAVAQARHLGRAGEQLGLTQPAVSKTLTELEELVGTRLLVRQRAGTDLTAAGMRFLRHALRILDDLDAAAGSLAGADGARHERIRVGALPSIVPALLLDAVNRFRATHADVALAVQTGMNRTLIDLLKADVLDIVIGRMDDPAAMEGLWFESLAAEPLVLAVRAGHPLATHVRPTVRDALGWPMVVLAVGSIPRHSTESLLARHGLALPEGCLETADAYLSQLVTLGSDSVWAAPLSATRRAVAAGEMVLLPVATPGTEEPIGLLRRSDRTPGPVAEAFVDTIRAIAARQAA